jgi:outer membrane lipoprotein-sorting protein
LITFTLVGLNPSLAQELSTKQVVDNMDQRAKAFSSLDASVSRTDTEYGVKAAEEIGRIYMKKASPATRIFYDVTAPAANRKSVWIDKGMGTIYFRNTNSYRTQAVGSGSEVTELLMIGFGAGSETYGKSYSPTYKGREAINSVQAVVLELSAKAESAQFRTIKLWLDPSTWTPLQTRVSRSSKAYSDFKYSNVRLNRGVSDSVFNVNIPRNATKQ